VDNHLLIKQNAKLSVDYVQLIALGQMGMVGVDFTLSTRRLNNLANDYIPIEFGLVSMSLFIFIKL